MSGGRRKEGKKGGRKFREITYLEKKEELGRREERKKRRKMRNAGKETETGRKESKEWRSNERKKS